MTFAKRLYRTHAGKFNCVRFLLAEVAKIKDTIISKNTDDVVGASEITYALIWQFSNTERQRRTYITLLYNVTELFLKSKGPITATQKL